MKALIIAAGNGTRLQSYAKGRHKSLLPLLGLKIIERIILTAKETGINEFVIVTGYEGKSIKALLKNGEKYGVSISYVENKDWEKANGISVLKAKQFFNEHFVLLMSDHIFASDTLQRIQRLHLKTDESALAIDKDLNSVNDINDTTKVVVRSNRVVSLDKNLSDYNAFDTGMFICSPYIFKTLERSIKQNKNSLSDGMRILVKEKKLRAFNIQGNFWADCDTHDDLKFAEKKLLGTLPKSTDYPIARIFNRKVSIQITKFLIKTPITPNIISLLILALAIFTSFLLAKGNYPWILIGGVLIQLASILDGCDGEIARLKFAGSKWGAWFDGAMDKYVDTFIVAGLAHGYWIASGNDLIWLIAIFVLLGIITDSYMHMKFNSIVGKATKWKGAGLERDLWMLLLALGAITNQVFFTMIIILLALNLKTVFRLIYARKMTSTVSQI